MSDTCAQNSHVQHPLYKQHISNALAGDGALASVMPVISNIIQDRAASGAFPYHLCVCVVHFFKLCEAIFPANSFAQHIISNNRQVIVHRNNLVCAIVQVGLAVVEPRAIHPSWKASMDIFMKERMASMAGAGGVSPPFTASK